MKLGVNTWVWVSPFTTEHIGLIPKVREMGFDTIEVPFEDLSLIDLRQVRRALDATGLSCTVCGAFGPTRDITSDDSAIRNSGMDYIEASLNACAELGADVFAGPLYSAVGKARLVSPEEKARDWAMGVENLGAVARTAEKVGVPAAIEPLNRFETDFINVAADALRMVREVNSPWLGVHLDTFHMHIEEKDPAQAIETTGPHLLHVHACENDRGTPGTGTVPWARIGEALRRVGYERHVVIESFTPGVKEIARAAAIWRKLEVDQDTLARQGLAFLRGMLPPPTGAR